MTRLQSWLSHVSEMNPYVIAEIGVNHENDVVRATAMIQEVAAVAPGHAVKFQAYHADQLAATYSPAYWDTRKTFETSQRALFRRFDKFTLTDYERLKVACVAAGVEFLVTAFDPDWIHALNPLVPAWKVASADLTNLPHLRLIAQQEKPVLLSTGAATLPEIQAAIGVLRAEGAPAVIALHCVLSYPCRAEDANLLAIATLHDAAGADAVGYSDHVPVDPDMETLTTAWLLGARVLEKHYTDDLTRRGNDHHHSMDRASLQRFFDRIDAITPRVGSGDRATVPAHESPARMHARRSWHATRNLAAGHVLGPGDLVALRPGTGIPPTVDIVGRRLVAPVSAGAAIPLVAVTPVKVAA